LQRQEQLLPLLDAAVAAGELQTYRSLPVASLQRQQQRREQLLLHLPTVVHQLQQVGLPDLAVEQDWALLTVEHWLESPAGQAWGRLLLQQDAVSGLLLPLQGLKDSMALQQRLSGLEGVQLMDRRSAYTRVFAEYRRLLGGLLVVAVLLITVYLLLQHGWQAGFRCLLPTLLSLLAAPAVLGLIGQDFNLFALLAMILVLGVGINYTLFFSNPQGQPVTALFATLLAAITTLLTLGILMFSSTQAISSFGWVLASGLLVAFLLSPLAGSMTRDANS
jgi:predicted exporter